MYYEFGLGNITYCSSLLSSIKKIVMAILCIMLDFGKWTCNLASTLNGV